MKFTLQSCKVRGALHFTVFAIKEPVILKVYFWTAWILLLDRTKSVTC